MGNPVSEQSSSGELTDILKKKLQSDLNSIILVG
jgi:hypothetical protein